MRIVKSFILMLMVVSIVTVMSCGDDDDPTPSLVNFAQADYNVDGVTLEPITVTLELDPAAAEATTITVDFSGGSGSFTTSPALSGSSLEIPVAAGATSVSFTITFNRSALPSQNLQVVMSLGELGPNLNSGITTSSNVNVPFIDLQTLPYAEPFGETGTTCDDVSFPPEGWVIETVVGNPNAEGTWSCITGAEGAFVHTGTGLAANAFLTGEPTEAWLVSPILGPITSSTTMSAGLDIRFDPNGGFPYDVDVRISTDYNGLNFGSATWESFAEAKDTWLANDFEVDDVTIYDFDLSAYEGEAISIAFIYICESDGACGLARFDDFSISN
ncbi:MAG TPA: choice-of-anchor J domain-containing protein [Cyclobacteriaceae bacterium]